MLEIVFNIFMAVFARQAGGGLKVKYLTDGALPEIFFSLTFTGYLALMLSPWFFAFAPLVFLAFQTGHGNALDFKDVHDPNRMNRIEPVVRWIADKLKIPHNTPAYDWIFMGLKGFLIGLPAGGVLLAFLWPLAYQIRNWIEPITGMPKAHSIAEALTGVFAAISAILFTIIIRG